jgi:hypothetical protein
MKHTLAENLKLNNSIELIQESQVVSPRHYLAEVVAEHIENNSQTSTRNDISAGDRLMNVVITSFQSIVDANTKLLERRLDMIEVKFDDYNQKLRVIEENLERMNTSRAQSNQLHSDIPSKDTENGMKRTMIDKSYIVSTDIDNSNHMRTYRSSAGRLLTAPSMSKVVLMPKFDDGQIWTTVPSRGKFVFLRNIHGGYLCAHPNGKIEARKVASGWEQWTIEKNNDGSVSLICSRGWYLSDKPENGLCVTKKLGFHKWWP